MRASIPFTDQHYHNHCARSLLAAARAAGASAHDAVAELARKERAKEKEKKRAADILGGGDGERAMLAVHLIMRLPRDSIL